MADRRARRVPGQPPRQLGGVVMRVPDILAPLDDGPRAIGDHRAPARAAARAVVVAQPHLIFDVALAPRNRTVAAGEKRTGLVSSARRGEGHGGVKRLYVW